MHQLFFMSESAFAEIVQRKIEVKLNEILRIICIKSLHIWNKIEQIWTKMTRNGKKRKIRETKSNSFIHRLRMQREKDMWIYKNHEFDSFRFRMKFCWFAIAIQCLLLLPLLHIHTLHLTASLLFFFGFYFYFMLSISRNIPTTNS